jgi:hypothetical protein
MKNKFCKIKDNKIKKILRYEIDLFLTEFKNTCPHNSTILFAPDLLTAEQWFCIFKSHVLDAIENKRFLPICRFVDGEAIFLNNGLTPVSEKLNFFRKLKIIIRNLLIKYNIKAYEPYTRNQYTSGNYSYHEIKKLNFQYKKNIKYIFENGIFAGCFLKTKDPGTEIFYDIIYNVIISNNIKITLNNYVPYVFVYALFAGKSKFEILNKKKILIINSFNIEQKKIITNKLKSFGAEKILYSNISKNRSAFDVLDIKLEDDIDLILIGAGVGKLFHFEYLSKFNVPCIDIGYIFQTWLDSSCASIRAFCSPDDIYIKELDK